jgi:bis(5'-adenosyl)-triphosphatase
MTSQINIPACPFCDESVLSSVFYAREGFMAICNIAPVLPGHSLIIPENHVTSILELSDHELFVFFDTARTALRILMKAFNTDSFDWSVQEKPQAGQTIEHLHLHIVPRITGDLPEPGGWYPLIQQNDNNIIDSFNRPRLNVKAMNHITGELKRVAKNLE